MLRAVNPRNFVGLMKLPRTQLHERAEAATDCPATCILDAKYLDSKALANGSAALVTGLHGHHLAGADLNHADLTHANLTGATLTKANLNEATLTDAVLHRVDLSSVGSFTPRHATSAMTDETTLMPPHFYVPVKPAPAS